MFVYLSSSYQSKAHEDHGLRFEAVVFWVYGFFVKGVKVLMFKGACFSGTGLRVRDTVDPGPFGALGLVA